MGWFSDTDLIPSRAGSPFRSPIPVESTRSQDLLTTRPDLDDDRAGRSGFLQPWLGMGYIHKWETDRFTLSNQPNFSLTSRSRHLVSHTPKPAIITKTSIVMQLSFTAVIAIAILTATTLAGPVAYATCQTACNGGYVLCCSTAVPVAGESSSIRQPDASF